MCENVLNKSFETAINIVNNLTNKPSNEELLDIYSFYKQAKFGNNNTDEPNNIFSIKNKKKWVAWNNLQGMDSNDAKQKYIDLSLILYKKYT